MSRATCRGSRRSPATYRELQKLSGDLLHVQDDERRRLSRSLHDELGQELTALKLELDIQNEKKLASEIAERALSKVRNPSYLLHPPLLDESGLLPAETSRADYREKLLVTRQSVRATFTCAFLPP